MRTKEGGFLQAFERNVGIQTRGRWHRGISWWIISWICVVKFFTCERKKFSLKNSGYLSQIISCLSVCGIGSLIPIYFLELGTYFPLIHYMKTLFFLYSGKKMVSIPSHPHRENNIQKNFIM